MKIPDYAQVFDHHVTLSYKDRDRLAPHLSNWNRLNDLLLIGVSEADLEKLILIEMMDKQRKAVLRRLVPPYVRESQKRIEDRIAKVVK